VLTSDQISAQFAASQQAQMVAMQQAAMYGTPPAYNPGASSSGALGMMGAGSMAASGGMLAAGLRGAFHTNIKRNTAGAMISQGTTISRLAFLDPFSASSAGSYYMRDAGMVGRFAGGAAGAIGGAAFMGAGLVADYAISSAYSGAKGAYQDQVLLNSQYQHLNPGGTAGSGFGKGGVDQISDATVQLARELQMDVDAIRQARTQLGNIGAMFGVTEVEQFTQKMRETIKLVTAISESLGGTIDEASVLYQHSRSTGFFTPQDVMGITGATKAASGMLGMPINEVMGIQRRGAAGAHQYGMRSSVGASLSTDYLMRLQLMYQGGSLTDDELDLATGMSGKEGIQAMAQQMTNASMALTKSRIGRALTIAIAGQDEHGNFTGESDVDVVRALQRGDISAGELRNIAGGKMRRPGAAASYESRKRELAGLMAEAGGVEMYANLFRGELMRGGRGFDFATDVTEKRLQDLGLSESLSRTVTEMSGRMPDMHRDMSSKVRELIESERMKHDQDLYGTFGGLFKRAGQWADEQLGQAAKDVGTRMYRNLRDGLEEMGDAWFGRDWAGPSANITGYGIEHARELMMAGKGSSLPSLAEFQGGQQGLAAPSFKQHIGGLDLFNRVGAGIGSMWSDYREGGRAVPKYILNRLSDLHERFGSGFRPDSMWGTDGPQMWQGRVQTFRLRGGDSFTGTASQYRFHRGREAYETLSGLEGLDRGVAMTAARELQEITVGASERGMDWGDTVGRVIKAVNLGRAPSTKELMDRYGLRAEDMILAADEFSRDALGADGGLSGVAGGSYRAAQELSDMQKSMQATVAAGNVEQHQAHLIRKMQGAARGSSIAGNEALSVLLTDDGAAGSLAMRMIQGKLTLADRRALQDESALETKYGGMSQHILNLNRDLGRADPDGLRDLRGLARQLQALEAAQARAAAAGGTREEVRGRLGRIERLPLDAAGGIRLRYRQGLEDLADDDVFGDVAGAAFQTKFEAFYTTGAGGQAINRFAQLASAAGPLSKDALAWGESLGGGIGLPRRVEEMKRYLRGVEKGAGKWSNMELQKQLEGKGFDADFATSIVSDLREGGGFNEGEMERIIAQTTRGLMKGMIGEMTTPGEQSPMGVILHNAERTQKLINEGLDLHATFAQAVGVAFRDMDVNGGLIEEVVQKLNARLDRAMTTEGP
jgi:hypothetical protein